MLVQRGYTVVQVDLRGSTGNGRVFREEFTANVGGQDLEDLVATVSLLTTTVQRALPQACGRPCAKALDGGVAVACGRIVSVAWRTIQPLH